MNVSIIVPTRNRADSLALTLQSLLGQSFPPANYEVLVVDNDSTDHTKPVASLTLQSNPQHQIRYVFEPVPGLLSGRHRGALEAKGELLIFVDDDIDADAKWLQAIVNTFEDESVQLVGGRNLPAFEVAPPPWVEAFWCQTAFGGRACGHLSLLDCGDKEQRIDANCVWGLNFSIRRQALFDLGGFHPDCIPDHLQRFQGDGETGLTIKANERGYKAVYQPLALVHHRIPATRLTPEYFKRRSFYQGVCDSYTEIRKLRRAGSVRPGENGGALGKRLRRYVTHPVIHARNFTQRWLAKICRQSNCFSAEPPELNEIKQRVKQAYQAGYTFHQAAVRSDPRLLEWILKEDYWDYRLPAWA